MKWRGMFILDELFRHAGIMFMGMGVVHVATLLFQVMSGRMLTPEDYSVLAAFIGLSVILQRPLSALTTSFAHQSRLLEQHHHEGTLRKILQVWAIRVGLPVLAVSLAMIYWRVPLSSILGLSDSAVMFYLGIMLPSLVANSVLEGLAQGLQLFKFWSAAHMSGALSRLLIGAALLGFLEAEGSFAIFAYAAGGYACTGILLLGLSCRLKQAPSPVNPSTPRIHQYFLHNSLALAAYAILMTLDVILVNRAFPNHPTFALSATLSRMIVFFPMAIGMALFPKVVSQGRGNTEQHQLFLRACKWTSVMVILSILACALFTNLLMFLLFGLRDVDAETRRHVWGMCVAMGFSALLNLILQYLLAQCRFRELAALLFFAMVYLLTGLYLPQSPDGVVLLAIVCNVAACAGVLPALRQHRGSSGIQQV